MPFVLLNRVKGGRIRMGYRMMMESLENCEGKERTSYGLDTRDKEIDRTYGIPDSVLHLWMLSLCNSYIFPPSLNRIYGTPLLHSTLNMLEFGPQVIPAPLNGLVRCWYTVCDMRGSDWWLNMVPAW